MQKTVLAFGYHNLQGMRHRNVCSFFEKQGYNVTECHTEKKGFIPKYTDLYRQFRAKGATADTIYVTFMAQYLLPLAWVLSRWHKKRLVTDLFVSIYDTKVTDRNVVHVFNPHAWVLWLLDWLCCHLSDEILVDTNAHKEFFVRIFGASPNNVRVLHLEPDPTLFFPKESPKNGANKHVLFYGNYIPLQGIQYIIDAAEILQTSHPHIRFTLIGNGQTYNAIRSRAEEKGVKTITWIGRIPYEELPNHIRSADVCLGIFDTGDKAARVIPHKVYEAVACGVPVITRDSPAIREKFENNKVVFLCAAGDAEELARTIVAVLA